MKKPYEKPVIILEQFDTGEGYCSNKNFEFYRSFCHEGENLRNEPICICMPLCGGTGWLDIQMTGNEVRYLRYCLLRLYAVLSVCTTSRDHAVSR